MDKTVQTYLNEYISLIGKGKFMLFGGNDFMNGVVPKMDIIEPAIDYYTMVDRSVAAGDVFNKILKTKAEFEKKRPDGSIEIAKGSATDEQYTAFVAEWKTKQEFLVKALIAEFDRLEGLAKGAAASGAPGLFGGAFATPKEALIASAAISGVLGVVKKKPVEEFVALTMARFTDGPVPDLTVDILTTYLPLIDTDGDELERLLKDEYTKNTHPSKKDDCLTIANEFFEVFDKNQSIQIIADNGLTWANMIFELGN